MNNFTIYCTEDQTKKALELGAPIKIFCKDYMYGHINYMGSPMNVGYVLINKDLYYAPTAEQMIGWLRENDLYINIIHISVGYTSWIKTLKENITLSEENTGFVNSFEEATIAAIDAALEYLINTQKQ